MSAVSVDQSALARVASWKSATRGGDLRLLVGIDIGATNTRVAVATTPSDFATLAVFETDRVSTLLASLEVVGASLASLNVSPHSSCLAAAGPISLSGTRVVVTNWIHQDDRTLDVSKLPASLCPQSRTRLLNDLEAACHGILGLAHSGTLPTAFETLFGATSPEIKGDRSYLVMAMGTGLGVGMLLSDGRENHKVVPLEIGHTLVTGYGGEYEETGRDQAMLQYISRKLYDGKHLAEFEDVCSGRGLAWVYEWLTLSSPCNPLLTTKEVAQRALSGTDKTAEQAMRTHYRFLMRAAQNCCVGLQTKGVVLAGDNQVSNSQFVRANRDALQTEFQWHPKQTGPKDKWLDGVPVFAQSQKFNTNLLGALTAASQL